MGGRPSKPVGVLVSEGRSHRTKAELEQRAAAESSLLSGKRITERPRVRRDEAAHSEFRRVVGLMRAIGKDDALYSEQVNRYSELYAEGEYYKSLVEGMRGELSELDSLSREVTAAARQISDISEEMDEFSAEELCKGVSAVLEALSDLIDKRVLIMRQIDNADTKIKQKREAMLAIERENCMTVSAALRTIPKDVHKDEEDELLKVLRED